MIPYGRQDISETDIEAVVATLRSDWLTQGPAVPRFEQMVAAYCGVRYAVAVANATAALHLACLALGLGPGKRLWTSPNTFVASANCGRYCGAAVDFVDIDPVSYNLSPAALADRLQQAEANDTLPDVLVPVHFAGQSCDMQAIAALARPRGIAIIEDASHAIGGHYQGRPIGCCEFSDCAVFSFHPVKIITSGEGGMILTNREDLYQQLVRLRSHGITRDPACMEGPSEGDWYYQQIELGFNYRMTDIQAALGASQMTRIDDFVRQRREWVTAYRTALDGQPLQLPDPSNDQASAWHLFVVQVQADGQRQRVFNAMRSAGIGVNVHYIPVHLQPYYRRLGFRPGDFPVAERYYRHAITLPLYPGLTCQDFRQVVDNMIAIFEKG
ncbi:UDP-4-amino-4,6-dideoxy-N-acetyl-beta-L-altrosamine transaminase [Chitinivorax tropicus]|uniref:UDP-4-amino-4, 6-dideoxy-N-acetyl-beta-L-altrosamine transaminase n=1 Tax=Chitinivorax tropicus TaxID=714531 RepID=A0A840MC23_9PROT|nr:UDP-4-amino-4,6-dideoxy-N-acetyl-beta-L-altrosamine transaminase [Chitinivorax tropicus]MBB5016874.1 UDP-4-amino-4,6-dideoxy-N-acetyl-beta-L-altrosamine transaminase [Chitinivorax tropicus]